MSIHYWNARQLMLTFSPTKPEQLSLLWLVLPYLSLRLMGETLKDLGRLTQLKLWNLMTAL